MEYENTQTANRQNNLNPFATDVNGGELARKRLDVLLASNAETTREKSLFRSEQEKAAAALIKNPLSDEQVFAYFGLLLGTFPPMAFFLRVFSGAGNFRSEDVWVLGVLAVINLISATVGYFSGKLIGKAVREVEKLSWTKMILILPFAGILWGLLTGGAGGIIIFVVGAIFGAFLGAAVGSVALPVFTIFHRLLKKGDVIDRRHFLPLGFGTALIISAFILGW